MAEFKKKSVVIGVILLAAILAAAKFFMPKSTQSTVTTTTPTNTFQQEPSAPAPTPESNSMMGGQGMMDNKGMGMMEKTASVVTHYNNPGGGDDVGFALSVDQNGTITDAQTEVLGKNPTTVMRQRSFAQALPGVIVGKKLSDITKLDRVGGSSLTTGAFNSALADLKAKLQ